LTETTDPARVIDAAEHALQRIHATTFSVLVIDDDPSMLEFVQTVLAAERLHVTSLEDPRGFWASLEATAPDLLILDIDMPGITGIELCQVVRSDPRTSQLPVLFLTARTDPEAIQRVFAAGADDYVAKPVSDVELLARVRNRLERARLLRQLVETDTLTGVYTRRKAEQRLDDLARLAQRQIQPFSIAVLDLDQFKSVNDRFGHAAGDEVLHYLGQTLLRAFRGEDVVGRLGGEEFVIGMYGMTGRDARRRMLDIRDHLHQKTFTAREGASFQAGFSAGVAQSPLHGSEVVALRQAADAALYQAKNDGRGRVYLSGAHHQPQIAHRSQDVLVVDDDEALGQLLLHVLGSRGYSCRVICDGQDALDDIMASPPRLVLLDMDLPSLNGLSILSQFAQEGLLANTRVIMLTVRSNENEVIEALELGAFDHIAKPFSLPVLMLRVQRALER